MSKDFDVSNYIDRLNIIRKHTISVPSYENNAWIQQSTLANIICDDAPPSFFKHKRAFYFNSKDDLALCERFHTLKDCKYLSFSSGKYSVKECFNQRILFKSSHFLSTSLFLELKNRLSDRNREKMIAFLKKSNDILVLYCYDFDNSCVADDLEFTIVRLEK